MAEENGEPKSPYGQYSEHDIVLVEAGNYFIQVGNDIFTVDGKMAFSRKRAEFFFDGIQKDLTLLKKNGTSLEQEDANACLLLLRIIPMKVH
jgi:hypothetical protein